MVDFMMDFKGTTLLIKRDETKEIVSVNDCIDVLEEGFKELASGVGKNQPRERIYTPIIGGDEAFFYFNNLAGALPKLDTMALRIDSFITKEMFIGGKKRKEYGKSFIGLILLFRISTGELLAILDDSYLSSVRVGATSAVGLRHLARKDSSVLGLFGAGKQAKTHLQGAIAVIKKLTKVKVFSINSANKEKFVNEMRKISKVEIIGVDRPEEVVKGSDVIICATNSSEPVFDGNWLAKGTTVVSIVGGDHTLKRREIDDIVLQKSSNIIVNSKSQIVRDEQANLFDRAGGRIKREEVVHELGDLLIGKAKGRINEDDIVTYHNNCGMGIQFAAVGAVVLKKAIAAGIGRPLPAEWFSTSYE